MREMKPLGLVFAGSLVALTAGSVRADSLVDNLSARSIGMGETMRGSAHADLSISLNPAGLALSRQLVLEASYGYRPVDNASRVSASACDATVPMPGCFYYQYFGASPEVGEAGASRRVHEAGSVFARQISDVVFAGLTVKYFDYSTSVPGEEGSSGFALDLGTVVRAGDHVEFGLAGYNLLAEDSPQYPRGLGSGVTFRPVNQLAVAVDGVWNFDAEEGEGGGRYGLGAEYFFTTPDGQSGVPIRAGGIYDAGRDGRFLTAGTGYVTRRAGIDAGLRYQLGDGDELIMLVSLRLFGPAFE